ncbi:MAG: DUF3147 family protein [Desulfosoma sp.]
MLILKIIISVGIILAATGLARRFPSAAGLIGVMPLTGALTLVWIHVENRGDPLVMEKFTKGALWGILPSVLFFLAALWGFKKGFSLSMVLALSFSAWAAAAAVHQWLFR